MFGNYLQVCLEVGFSIPRPEGSLEALVLLVGVVSEPYGRLPPYKLPACKPVKGFEHVGILDT